MSASQLIMPWVNPASLPPKERSKLRRQETQAAQTAAQKLAALRRVAEELNQALYQATGEDRPTVHSPADCAALLQPFMAPLQQEELWVTCLNTRNQIMHIVAGLYRGSANSAQVRLGELFRPAIQFNATSIIIAHNHPSGDPTPSPDDISLTRALVQAGKLLDIEVLDHLVIGRERFVSLKERGLGFS